MQNTTDKPDAVFDSPSQDHRNALPAAQAIRLTEGISPQSDGERNIAPSLPVSGGAFGWIMPIHLETAAQKLFHPREK